MANDIATRPFTSHSGMYCNARTVGRTLNGILWFVLGDRANDQLEFHWSDDNGVTWTQNTNKVINNVGIGGGHSMRLAARPDGAERIVVLYRDNTDNKMTVSFGEFRTHTRKTFSWHPASPKHTSTQRASSFYVRPDLECWWNGRTWLCPTVWGEQPDPSPGIARLMMGRTRFVTDDSFSVDEIVVHDRYNMTSWPRPSAMLRHSGDPRDVHAASPDLYFGWHQGIDADPSDRGYMMRLVLSGSTWGVGTLRVVEQNGTQSGLTAGCYTGQVAAWAQVPSNATEGVLLHLMQPSDGSRTKEFAPAPNLGEIENIAISWDSFTYDIYILASGANTQRPHWIRYDWETRGWTTWTELNTDAVKADTLHVTPGNRDSRIDCVYAIDVGGTSTTFRHELVVQTNVIPGRATWNTGSGAYDPGVALILDWAHNDPDNDPQAQYELRRAVDGGAYEYWNGSTWQTPSVQPSSAVTEVTLSAGWATTGETHEYEVRTADLEGLSAWSPVLSVLASTPINPTIDTPAPGSWSEPKVTTTWTVAEQSSYRVRLLDGSSNLLYSSGWLGSTVVASFEIDYLLQDGQSYTVEVTTRNAAGTASAPDTVAITASLIPPPSPTFTLTANTATGAIEVDIDNGTPGGGEAAAATNTVWRAEADGLGGYIEATEVIVGINVAADSIFSDLTAASGVLYTYAVEPATAVGSTVMSSYDPTGATLVLFDVWLHDATDLTSNMVLDNCVTLTEELQGPSMVRLYASGRTRESHMRGAVTTVPLDFELCTRAEVDQFRTWAGTRLLLRDPRGRSLYGGYEGKQLSIQEYPAVDRADVSLTFAAVTPPDDLPIGVTSGEE